MIHVGKSCFYTPNDLSNFLISQIPEGSYKHAIDICCGSWNLLGAVKSRWPEIDIIGIDLDCEARKKALPTMKFILGDGRLTSLKFIKENRLFDIVVANPPFGSITNPLYRQLPKYVDLAVEGIANKRLETDMMLTNASLVKENGWLVAIVPSSFVDATSYLSIRKLLAAEFDVKMILKLPNKIFGNREVNSYGLILHKTAKVDKDIILPETPYYKASVDITGWRNELIHNVPISAIRTGYWVTNLPQIDRAMASIEIYRGMVSSHNFTNTGKSVLHSSAAKLGKSWQPSLRYIHETANIPLHKTAQRGDIIINRVGRSAGYWCIYKGSATLISDCLIVVRGKQIQILVNALHKQSGNGCLRSFVKGITAQYVSQKELHAWLCNNVNYDANASSN